MRVFFTLQQYHNHGQRQDGVRGFECVCVCAGAVQQRKPALAERPNRALMYNHKHTQHDLVLVFIRWEIICQDSDGHLGGVQIMTYGNYR